MVDLDDASALRALDRSGMLGVVAGLGAYALEAYRSGTSTTGLPSVDGITAIVFCGMGGSAVAGDVLRQGFRDRLPVPVEVNRSPILPAFAGPHTLVLSSSYSGNTSETLAASREAIRRGCRMIAVTSGGELARLCAEHGVAVATVASGFQPRAALGHLAFSTLGTLEAAGLLPPLGTEVDAVGSALAQLARGLGPDVATEENPAKELAAWIGERIPVVWGAEGIGVVAAMRWKTQFNENGKVPAWFASMSELDHNEVVGWVPPLGGQAAVIALRSDHEPPELTARFPLSADIARDAGAIVRDVEVGGRPALASLLSLIMIGDFTSCYVGLRRGHDPTPVDAITRLKTALAAMDLPG